MAPPAVSDDAAAAGQRARSRRAPTKSRKADEPVGDESRATARTRPYPEPKSHKASKKPPKGSNEQKPTSPREKKAQTKPHDSPDANAEYENEEEVQNVQVLPINPGIPHGAAQPVPVAPQSYYPPTAQPQPYEAPLPPVQKPAATQPQPLYQPYQEEAPPRPNRPTGSLSSLADGPEGPEGRPPYPYSTLIRYAIEGSERGKLTLSELYTHIEARFPWFGKNGAGWKNSIRHNLSLNKSFVKIPRPLTEPGKGSYWCINYSTADGENASEGGAPEPAKRKRKKKEDTATQPHEVEEADSVTIAPPQPAPSVYDNPYPSPGYNGHTPTQAYGYPPQHGYPSPHVQQQHTGAEAQEEEEYDDEDAPGEQDATTPYQEPQQGYYAHQQYAYQHPAPPGAPPIQHPAPVEHLYPGSNPPQNGYYAQHPAAVPYPQQHYPVQADPSQFSPQPPPQPQAAFVDDRPDRTAPRTIYNHAGGHAGGPYSSAAPATTPLGALATSVPHVSMNPPPHPHMYGAQPQYAYGHYPPSMQAARSPQGYTSSLGGAMGPPPS